MAWRFLRVRRSRGAVGAIAAVSVVGVAVAVAAIICVLSVFNGFREVLTERSGRMLADIEISPAAGKTLRADSLLETVRALDGVELAVDVVSDQALAIFDTYEMPVRLYAADLQAIRQFTEIDSLIYAGGSYPHSAISFDKAPEGLLSVGVASRLHSYNPGDVVFIFAPRRVGTINTANPAASFITDSITAAGVFESGDELFDTSTVILPPEVARPLFMYDDTQASAIAVKGKQGADIDALAARIREALAPVGAERFVVRTRAEQQQISFRMVNIEKWVTFLLLIFILAIASFNIISTMTMFVLEKRHDLQTMRAMGMTRRRIGRVFAWQSVFVTGIGTISGMVLGLALCLLQEHFGWLTMGDSAIGNAPVIPYPVSVEWIDFPLTLIPLIIIGALTAAISAAFARSRSE